MKQKIYQVDAFTDNVFGGNPAAVCPLNVWLADDLLQQIAMENNQAETVFYVRKGNEFEIRWFTPTVEVDLCGHATLAASFVLFEIEQYKEDTIIFNSHRSGILKVTRQGNWFTLDFPTDTFERTELTSGLLAGFNHTPIEAYKGKTDYMLVFSSQREIETLQVNIPEIEKLTDCRGIIVTAKGDTEDFVSRFFAPQSGISEDPVTGSAHTTLTPYWSGRLNKTELTAVQLSKRKGHLKCRYNNERTEISGNAKLYMQGTIEIGN